MPRMNDNGIKRRTDAYGREVNLLGNPAIGSKAQWAPSINLPQYQNELMNTGNARFMQEQAAAQTGIAQTNQDIMRSMSFDQPAQAPDAAQAPEYVKSKQMQDWQALYSREAPRLNEAKTLTEYNDQFARLRKMASNSGMSTDAINMEVEEQRRKWMPDSVKLEQQTEDLMKSLTPEQQEQYQVVGGKIVENPKWKLQNELDTLDAREKQKSKSGLGKLGNEIWQDLPHDSQNELLKQYHGLLTDRRATMGDYLKAKNKIDAMPEGDAKNVQMQNLKILQEHQKSVQAEIDHMDTTYFTKETQGTETTTEVAPATPAPEKPTGYVEGKLQGPGTGSMEGTGKKVTIAPKGYVNIADPKTGNVMSVPQDRAQYYIGKGGKLVK